MIYFTSDLHIGHKNILKYQQDTRPYTDIDEHDKWIIDTINSTCTKKDELYVLGDISVSQSQLIQEKLKKIDPHIFLVRGNHDHWKESQEAKLFERVWDYRIVHWDKQRIVCFHFPIEEWNRCEWGDIHLHGHCHGSCPTVKTNRFDIGWDVHKRPVSIDEILSWKNTNEEHWVTHHDLVITNRR